MILWWRILKDFGTRLGEENKFMNNISKSQVETTTEIKNLVAGIKKPLSFSSLIQIRDLMYTKLEFRIYDDSSAEHEKSIRWKRTAGEILNDAYVYSGKACTDLTVLYIALCRAIGLETRFVKVKRQNMVHSIAEIKLDDAWYVFDISRTNVPFKGEITTDNPYKDSVLWKKGRDAWDIGLIDFESMSKIS
jgi:hypothetical protein